MLTLRQTDDGDCTGRDDAGHFVLSRWTGRIGVKDRMVSAKRRISLNLVIGRGSIVRSKQPLLTK